MRSSTCGSRHNLAKTSFYFKERDKGDPEKYLPELNEFKELDEEVDDSGRVGQDEYNSEDNNNHVSDGIIRKQPPAKCVSDELILVSNDFEDFDWLNEENDDCEDLDAG